MYEKDKESRVLVVDALRGFALVSIMLLHNIEMFEVHAVHPALPTWMVQLDKIIWDTFFFLFGGKSYAIFALLFGFTFYIQTSNCEKNGIDFRLRFAWRLFLLLIFGMINTLFYRGEILVLYALLGFFIIPFSKLSNKTILLSAVFLLLHPIFFIKLIIAIQNPTLEPSMPIFIPYYMKSDIFLTSNSIIELMKSNITDGRIASLLWYWEYGRIEQTLGLFLLGFLAGRKGIFYNTNSNLKFWKNVLIISALLFCPLFLLKLNSEIFSESKNVTAALTSIFTLWSNLAFMLVLVSGFILLFYNNRFQPLLNKISPIGKMSLSNYILQSIVGANIYYGFGLGIYRYVGSTYCLLIGIVLAIGMGIFSHYWMSHNKRGILESLWHKLTWMGTDKK